MATILLSLSSLILAWISLSRQDNIVPQSPKLMETPSYMQNHSNLTQDDFMEKIYNLKKWLYDKYPKPFEDGSFPPPKGSQMHVIEPLPGSRNYEIVTEVFMFLVTSRIVKMDIEGQSLVMVVDEYMFWNDTTLSWRVWLDEDIGLSDIILSAKKIWTPSIYSMNRLDQKVIRDVEDVKIYSSGLCSSTRTMQYTIPCTINVEKFPFDRHNCSLRFTHPVNSHSRISFISMVDELQKEKSNYVPFDTKEEHLEWELLDWKISNIPHNLEEPETFEYMLMLRRRATFYFTVLILPCIVLNVLSVTVFTLPVVDSGRMDFVLALILTYFVLIMIVVESSPPSGNQIPLLGLYIILSTAVVGTTYGMSMVLIEMREHCRMKKKEMPHYLAKFLEYWCCLNRRYGVYKKRRGIKADGNKVAKNTSKSTSATLALNGSNVSSVEVVECDSEESLRKEGYKWKLLGKVLNLVFFMLVCIAHLVVSMAVFNWY